MLDAHATGKKDMVEARGLFLEALENAGATVDPNVSTIGDLAGLILHLYGEQMVKVEEAMEAKAAAEADRDNLSQYLDDLQSQRDNAVQKMEDAVRTKRLLEDRLMHGDEIANAEKRKVEIALATANSELSACQSELESTQKDLEKSRADVLRLSSADELISDMERRVEAMHEQLDNAMSALKIESEMKQSLEQKLGRITTETMNTRDNLTAAEEEMRRKDAELAQAKESLDAAKAIIEGEGGESAKITYWKKEKVKVDEELKKCNKLLTKALEKVAAGDSLEEKLRKLIQDYNSCKQELANFKYDLQETMKKLQISSQTGQSLESRLDEIIREYAFCQERVYVAVNPVHMRSKRQQERQGAVNKEQRRLQPLLQTLIDRYHAVRFTMERSERAARVSSERLIELQIQLDEVEMSSTKRMEKAVITAKSERQALVKAALGSLQQLRMYLTQTLEAVGPLNRRRMTRRTTRRKHRVERFKSRWGVLPNAVAAAADELEQRFYYRVMSSMSSLLIRHGMPRHHHRRPPRPTSPHQCARVRAVHGGSPRLRTALPATPDQEDVAFFNHQVVHRLRQVHRSRAPRRSVSSSPTSSVPACSTRC